MRKDFVRVYSEHTLTFRWGKYDPVPAIVEDLKQRFMNDETVALAILGALRIKASTVSCDDEGFVATFVLKS